MDRNGGGECIMKIASIDVGTNTMLLLIVEVDKNGIIQVLHDEQVIARLGKGVDSNQIINQETFLRAENFFQAYKQTCDLYAVDKIVAVGTSALRDAKNREEFCAYIQQKVGITIDVISGDEEAKWTYRGGISEFSGQSDKYSVIDIGGGSTEIIVGNEKEIVTKTSINIGSVRLTERILHQSPPEDSAIIEAHEFILSQMPKDQFKNMSPTMTIGVAGTLTTLASLHQHLQEYDPKKISGYQLTYENICEIFALLKDKNLEQLKLFPQISQGRADILLAGIMILMGFMEATQLTTITVSDRGLRYGIVYSEIEKIIY